MGSSRRPMTGRNREGSGRCVPAAQGPGTPAMAAAPLLPLPPTCEGRTLPLAAWWDTAAAAAAAVWRAWLLPWLCVTPLLPMLPLLVRSTAVGRSSKDASSCAVPASSASCIKGGERGESMLVRCLLPRLPAPPPLPLPPAPSPLPPTLLVLLVRAVSTAPAACCCCSSWYACSESAGSKAADCRCDRRLSCTGGGAPGPEGTIRAGPTAGVGSGMPAGVAALADAAGTCEGGGMYVALTAGWRAGKWLPLGVIGLAAEAADPVLALRPVRRPTLNGPSSMDLGDSSRPAGDWMDS